MRDYATTAAGFDLQRTAAATLSGTLQALNACVECCDRHALPGRIALFWEGKDGSRASYTFSELKALSGRFANFLQAQGVRPGDCVAGLLPRTPELLVTILGAWRLGAVYQPLFTAFGPKAIEHRVATAGSKVLVTDAANRDKLDRTRRSASGRHRRRTEGQGIRRGDFSFWAELERYPAEFEPVHAQRRGSVPDDVHLRHHRPGQTGAGAAQGDPRLRRLPARGGGPAPRGRLLEPRRSGLGLRPLLRCRRSLAMGHPTTFYEGPFSVESTCRIIRDYGITNLAGSPTAYRLLMAPPARPRKLR